MRIPEKISPYSLIQEELKTDGWRMLVACIMLNQTSITQVRQVIWKFFETYPTPFDLADANHSDVVTIISPLGLQNRRATHLIQMSLAWLDDWKDPLELPGVGKYAKDSWTIFIEGKLLPEDEVDDKELKNFVRWASTYLLDGEQDEMGHPHRVVEEVQEEGSTHRPR